MKIYCPKCKWKPPASARWMCEPACRHAWNTFDTGGVCPKCRKKWQYTQCLSCGVNSPHAEWYHEEDGADSDNLDAFYEYITEEMEDAVADPAG